MSRRLRARGGPPLAVAALLLGTFMWGTIWYPYRALAAWGWGALTASAVTYLLALILAGVFHGRRMWIRPDLDLVALSLTAGITNVGFIWATNHGLILRVMLLFYLMPVWSVFAVWWLLGILPTWRSVLLLVLALSGAALMLWTPNAGVPVPTSVAEWAALVAGMCFALSNALVKRAEKYDTRVKSIWMLAGCALLAAVGASFEHGLGGAQRGFAPVAVAIALGTVLFAGNLVVQYGVERVAPTRVPIIYLFELVVAAVSALLLAGEAIHWREIAGGVLIVGSTLLPHATGEEPQG